MMNRRQKSLTIAQLAGQSGQYVERTMVPLNPLLTCPQSEPTAGPPHEAATEVPGESDLLSRLHCPDASVTGAPAWSTV